MAEFIPVNEPLLDGNEARYVRECVESGWISSEGPFVSRFEEAFTQRVGRRYGIAVANGSGALDIAVKALDIGPGDEVIMPTFTIISPAASVVRQGGTPVLVDSDPQTWNMDVSQVEQRITSRTRAILVVHTYGLPVDMDPVAAIAARHRLEIIEDAAEMHGQTYKGRACGSFGRLSVFSFYANKHVTTGEGGMLVTDDEQLAERCRSLRNLCFDAKRRFVHQDLGWNYRMTNLQAAVGLAQLERLDWFVQRKRELGKLYAKWLQAVPDLQLPMPRADYAENIYWVFGVVLGAQSGLDAQGAMQQLAQRKVGTRPFFYPMHQQPVFRARGLFENERFPVAEKLAARGFYLPSGLAMTAAQIESAAGALIAVLEDNARHLPSA